MNNIEWIEFFKSCNQILGRGSRIQFHSDNWCSWTTFDRILKDTGYWQSGIPSESELASSGLKDGGTWGQPFEYCSIAHLILPRSFEFIGMYKDEFHHKKTEQDLDGLSSLLNKNGIEHVLSEYALELRLIK